MRRCLAVLLLHPSSICSLLSFGVNPPLEGAVKLLPPEALVAGEVFQTDDINVKHVHVLLGHF